MTQKRIVFDPLADSVGGGEKSTELNADRIVRFYFNERDFIDVNFTEELGYLALSLRANSMSMKMAIYPRAANVLNITP